MRWNGRHSSAFTVERGVRQGSILSPHLFNLYTESVIRQAEIEDIAIRIGGKWALIWDTQTTPIFVQSKEEAERSIGKVNNMIVKSRLLKLNVKETKLLTTGKIQSDAGVWWTNGGGRTFQITRIAKISWWPLLQKHQMPNWNGQENNARASTNMERQRNEQRPENGISSLAGVDSSHLWRSMLDSDGRWWEKDRTSRPVDPPSDVTIQLDWTSNIPMYPDSF